jgi:hypothetical protein
MGTSARSGKPLSPGDGRLNRHAGMGGLEFSTRKRPLHHWPESPFIGPRDAAGTIAG